MYLNCSNFDIFCHFDILSFWHLILGSYYVKFFLTFWHFWQNFNLIYLVYNCKIKNFCEVSFWHFLTLKCQNLTKMSKFDKNVKIWQKCQNVFRNFRWVNLKKCTNLTTLFRRSFFLNKVKQNIDGFLANFLEHF